MSKVVEMKTKEHQIFAKLIFECLYENAKSNIQKVNSNTKIINLDSKKRA